MFQDKLWVPSARVVSDRLSWNIGNESVLNNIPEEQRSLFSWFLSLVLTGLYVVVLPVTLYCSGILLCFFIPPLHQSSFYCEIIGSCSGAAGDWSFLRCKHGGIGNVVIGISKDCSVLFFNTIFWITEDCLPNKTVYHLRAPESSVALISFLNSLHLNFIQFIVHIYYATE